MFMGVVSASSINGDYKGNPIVKVKSDGKLLESDEVPAMIYEGQTLVPISLLRQLGAYVNWDADTYSVDIRLSQPSIATPKPANFRDVLKSTNGNMVFFTFNDKLYAGSNFNMKTSFNQDWPEILKVINKLTEQDVDFYIIYYMSNGSQIGTVALDRQSAEDFANGKISSQELDKRWTLTGFYNQNQPQPTPYIQPTPHPTVLATPQPQATPKPVYTPSPTAAPAAKTDYMLLYSNDGKTYLGKLTSNVYDADSIFNDYGTYGGKYSAESIFNDYGTYGGKYSSESPFNPYTTTPPMIILNGKIVGYLTINSYITGAFSPLGLKEWLKNQGY